MSESTNAPPSGGRAGKDAGGHGSSDETTADRLLQLAAALFREKGYAASTTRELAGRLGIQNASLYHHIRSKEDLLFAISMESLSRIAEAVTAAGAAADPNRRLEAMIIAHVETALADQDMHTSMLIELRALSPGRKKEVLALRDQYQALLKNALREGQAAGQLRKDIEPRFLTLSLLNLLNWTIFWFDPDGDLTAHDVAVTLSMVFLDGARIREP